MRRTLAVVLTSTALLSLTACSDATTGGSSTISSVAPEPASAPSITSQAILDKQSATVLNQPLAYPTEQPAQVSSSLLTVPPGASTGRHKHDAPMYAYILEGTITVAYDGGVTKEYPAGSGFLEAVGTWHDGTNLTDQPVRILVVNLGAEGVANTVKATL